MNSSSAAVMRSSMSSSPFTESQWQELEHQALIFKYLNAGVPVPSDLLLPIQKSFESLSARFFSHPSMAYCSFYGKKVDPEPGRCRRTDGKKWRCSKDVYPDSKYCERHMHRGRNRSRKPVESSQTASHSSRTLLPTTSTATTNLVASGTFQNLPLHSFANSSSQVGSSNTHPSHFNLDPISYGATNKHCRYSPHGYKSEVGGHSLFEAASASGSESNNRGVDMESPLDSSSWPLMPSRLSSFPLPKSSSIAQNEYPLQHSFFSPEFASGRPVKQECQQPLRPFFDEWPRTRDSWSSLQHETHNQTTQLSISIPNASSSEFSTTSPCPGGE